MKTSATTVLVLDGPNLNLLGCREPDIYGRTTLEEIHSRLRERAAELGVTLTFLQSNHEGRLIDALHEAAGTADGVIINPGGLTHTSVSLADAVRAVSIPTVEVHLSNIFAREPERRQSLIAPAAVGVVAGFGWRGYLLALDWLAAAIPEGRGGRVAGG